MADTEPDRQPPAPAVVVDCKLVLLGQANSGKTSLVTRLVKHRFVPDQGTTVGAAFTQHLVPLPHSNDIIQFGIWDTAGSERFRSLAPMYYRGAQAAIIVYDVTSRQSFEDARTWLAEVRQHGLPNVVLALAANKCDREDQRQVSTQEGQLHARQHEMAYIETSAMTGQNVSRLFLELASQMPRPIAQTAAQEHISLSGGGRRPPLCCAS